MLRDPDRRSFLARVLGGALLAGGALILGSEAAAQRRRTRRTPVRTRRLLLDRDPSDPAQEPGVPRPMPQDPPSPPGPVINRPSNHRIQGMSSPLQRFVVCPGHRRCPR